MLRDNLDQIFSREEGQGPTNAGAQSKVATALSQFRIDLTASAGAGALDPVVGRDSKIRQIFDVLLRRRQIRTLDLGLLLAGASMRGEFEDRLKQLMREVQNSPKPIILFVDEAHMPVGDRSESANLLKPSLARGELRIIAATTYVEYRKNFEQHPALARRFQMIADNEPTEESAIQMVRGLVPHLERHHGVRILGEAVRAAVKLSHRYVTGRQLPDRAIAILDTACARVASAQNATLAAITTCQDEITALENEIRELERERAFGIDVRTTIHSVFEHLGVAEMKLANLEDRREERELVAREKASDRTSNLRGRTQKRKRFVPTYPWFRRPVRLATCFGLFR